MIDYEKLAREILRQSKPTHTIQGNLKAKGFRMSRRMQMSVGGFPMVDANGERVTLYEREKPARKPNVNSDFSTLFLQSLGSGFFSWLLIASGDGIAGFAWWAWNHSLFAGVVVAAAVWAHSVSLARWQWREVERVEVEHDPYEKEVVERTFVMHGMHGEDKMQNAQTVLPNTINKDVFVEVMAMCHNGVKFTARNMARKLSRGAWEDLRDFLLDIHWVEWKDATNKKLGVQWTNAGKAARRNYADGKVVIK